MLGVMQLSDLERQYPHITNEDPAHEFVGKVDRIGAHWQARLPAWPWGPADHLPQYLEFVKVGGPPDYPERTTLTVPGVQEAARQAVHKS